MRRSLLVSVVALSILLLILSCAKPKRTNPYDPANPNAPGTLQGKVTDTEAFPLAGAKVSTSPVTADAISDSIGNYQLQNLSPQSYQVIVSAASHDTAVYTVKIDPVLSTTLNPQLVYNGPGEITGTITEVGTNRVVRQGFVYTRPDSQLHRAQTDGAGNYRLTDVPSGTYFVVAAKDQYYSRESLQVTLPPKRAIRNLQLQPRLRGTISGVVTSPVGPINGVGWVTSPPTDTVYTNFAGQYAFNQVIPGTYLVRAVSAPKPPLPDSAYNWSGKADTAIVTTGHVTTLNFLLERLVWWRFDSDMPGQPARGWGGTLPLWLVFPDTAAFSDPNLYLAYDTMGASRGKVSLCDVPGRVYTDFYYLVGMRIPSQGPGWRTGMLFRLADSLRFYEVSMTSGSIALIKSDTTRVDTLETRTILFAPDVWHWIGIDCRGTTIQVIVNNNPIINRNDGRYTQGWLGLKATRVVGFFDNVTVMH